MRFKKGQSGNTRGRPLSQKTMWQRIQKNNVTGLYFLMCLGELQQEWINRLSQIAADESQPEPCRRFATRVLSLNKKDPRWGWDLFWPGHPIPKGWWRP